MKLKSISIVTAIGLAAAAIVVVGSASRPYNSFDSLEVDSAFEAAGIIRDTASQVKDIPGGWMAPMLLPEEKSDDNDKNGVIVEPDYAEIARQMSDFASNYLGIRYRLGATGPRAFDCSAFMAHIYKNFGMTLPRTSRQQYRQGDKVDLKNVKPGDLLFFSGRRISKTVGHVGMVTSVDPVTGEVEMIHASSSKGIARQKFPDNGYFSRRFIGARRMLGTAGFKEVSPKS